MRTSQCAVYQVKETPEYRDVRFRSYEKLRSEGKSVSIENYQQVYIGRIQPGETPADIKIRLQKQRPKNFKGHSIGCSDVLVITDEGKTTAYYINRDGFIIVPEFLTSKSSSNTRLSIDTTGYEIEGKKGTWLAQDYILMNEKKWFLMEHEEYGTRAAYVILSEEGAVIMNDCYNGFDEEARHNIQNFMQQQVAKEQEQQRQQQVQSQMQSNQIQQSPEQQKKKPELANWQKVMDNGEYLRSAEMAEEANYNMIDGLMNNVRKKKDKDKPRESVLARLRLNQKKVAKQGKKQTQQKAMAEDMVVGMTSSVVIPDNRDSADVLPDNTNLYSRLYALKKILPQKDADMLARELEKLISKTKIDIYKMNVLPANWKELYDKILFL